MQFFLKLNIIPPMGILNFFRKAKKSAGENPDDSLLSRINFSMDLLVQKSQNLGEQFAGQKKEIEEIAAEAKKIRQSDEIFSAKLEQDILGNITAVSSACDDMLSGREISAEKNPLASLKTSVSQRRALK